MMSKRIDAIDLDFLDLEVPLNLTDNARHIEQAGEGGQVVGRVRQVDDQGLPFGMNRAVAVRVDRRSPSCDCRFRRCRTRRLWRCALPGFVAQRWGEAVRADA